MGGDSGPAVLVSGAVAASVAEGISIILVGNEELLKKELSHFSATEITKISIEAASEVIEMSDSPAVSLRSKPDASIRIAFTLLKARRVCAVVSAGNTGAMMAAGLAVCGALPSITRPAIATLIPRLGKSAPIVLLDSGANVDSSAEQLVQFALMGSAYSRLVLGVKQPRVGFLANGSEANKGNEILRSAASKISTIAAQLSYVGFVEGGDFASERADVIVCDGFVGNVALKSLEGAVALSFGALIESARETIRGTLGLWLLRSCLIKTRDEKLNASWYGGAPLLGLDCAALVCHGASDARAVQQAVSCAARFANSGTVEELRAELARVSSRGAEVFTAPSK